MHRSRAPVRVRLGEGADERSARCSASAPAAGRLPAQPAPAEPAALGHRRTRPGPSAGRAERGPVRRRDILPVGTSSPGRAGERSRAPPARDHLLQSDCASCAVGRAPVADSGCPTTRWMRPSGDAGRGCPCQHRREGVIASIWARTVSVVLLGATVSDLRPSAPRSPHETDRAQIDGTTDSAIGATIAAYRTSWTVAWFAITRISGDSLAGGWPRQLASWGTSHP